MKSIQTQQYYLCDDLNFSDLAPESQKILDTLISKLERHLAKNGLDIPTIKSTTGGNNRVRYEFTTKESLSIMIAVYRYEDRQLYMIIEATVGNIINFNDNKLLRKIAYMNSTTPYPFRIGIRDKSLLLQNYCRVHDQTRIDSLEETIPLLIDCAEGLMNELVPFAGFEAFSKPMALELH